MAMEQLTRDLSRDVDDTFPKVVELMANRLFWGLRRMTGDHQHAEDLSQETMIRAYQALKEYEPDRIRKLRLESWIWTIAMNLGRNHLRDRSRRPTLVAEKFEPVLEDEDTADGAAWEKRLSELSTPQRRAVVLRHVIGLSIDEIATVTGRPQGTCKADIHRGLKRLREIMENEDES